jgi:hypothetical protein
VFARSPPGSVQPAATAGFGEPGGVLLAWLAAACLAEQLATLDLVLLAQPPTARPAATVKITPATAGRLTR